MKTLKEVEESNMLKIVKLNNLATFDMKTVGSGGYDLTATMTVRIESGEAALIPSGIKAEIPPGYIGLLSGRSSLNTKLNCMLIEGRIDSDYRGEILMNVVNMDINFPRVIKEGTRIAQLVVVPIYTGEVKVVKSLSKTNRGGSGFGSTGEGK